MSETTGSRPLKRHPQCEPRTQSECWERMDALEQGVQGLWTAVENQGRDLRDDVSGLRGEVGKVSENVAYIRGLMDAQKEKPRSSRTKTIAINLGSVAGIVAFFEAIKSLLHHA